jgi:predicted DNA-binding transcriptional regulator YafY
MTELEGGGLEFRARVNSLVEVASWILGFGPEAWAVSPPELVERVRAALARTAQRYETKA